VFFVGDNVDATKPVFCYLYRMNRERYYTPMASIIVEQLNSKDGVGIYVVEVIAKDATHTFTVELDDEYYTVLGEAEGYTREQLIQRAFQFLLERESASEIMPEFNIREIEERFPEFEEELIK